MEDRLDRIERDGKRNKIVIRGFEKGTRPAKEAVDDLLKEKLEITARVAEAYEIKLKSG